ncbi:MAG: DUF4145 domain-containing protein [Novosphingobium sp.]|nr:DUF4145 domain-containing protein [Novosphingobium sp.]
MSELPSAEAAILKAWREDHAEGETSRFVCPHCGAYTQQEWGKPLQLARYLLSNVRGYRDIAKEPAFTFSFCTSCHAESLFRGTKLLFPSRIMAPQPSLDMPADVTIDFEEARQICGQSPRGAAALLRLAIQKLCPQIGASDGDVNHMIKQLVADGIIPSAVQKALDAVRVIGNEAVHPGELDLRDDVTTVQSLFGLVNFIVEKAITEPKEIQEIFDRLPESKRNGIEQRDAPANAQRVGSGPPLSDGD